MQRDMKTHHDIAASIIVSGSMVLVQQRSEDGHLSGYWEFPGGKVEAGESPLAAAVREAQEETGVNLQKTAPVWQVHLDYQYPDRALKLHFFCFHLSKKPESTADIRWIEISQLSQLKLPPANQSVIERLEREFLQSNA
jgi:8-oxo-dGTP diphosphatase